ncbi:MAG: cardiolipin synthase [Lachnospirales bacterium]
MIYEYIGTFFSYLVSFGYVLNIFWTIYVLFYEKKTPGVIWAWLMVLFILPGFGFILYFVFGFDGRKHKRFAIKAKEDNETFRIFNEKYPEIAGNINDIVDKKPVGDSKSLENIMLMNKRSGKSPLRDGNSLKLYHEGMSKFKDLFEDIKNAEKFIHMEYYLVHDDKLGTAIMRALAQKAREGVEVKLLYDGMGNAANRPHFRRILKKAGGQARLFLPPRGVRLNYRDHRKIAVIDGKIGYVGGLNIGDEYVSKKKRFGFWRDTHIRICGNAVKDLELRFIMDWNFTKGEKLEIESKYFPRIEAEEDNVNMQIISSGPDCQWDSIQYTYFQMVNKAEKRVYIATPYFVPEDSLLEALRTAALSGIDVRVVIPAKPDHPFVYYSSINYLGELLEAGVKCYEYTKGFIHAKIMTMDSIATCVGTANMDIRSFKLNFEVNAVIYDKNITEEFDKQFEIDFKDCREITKEIYDKRGRRTRIKEAIARLISPLL